MTLSTFLTVFIIVFIAMVPLSLIVETLRPKPKKPDEINWGKDIPIQYIDLDGTKVRYIKVGNGPTLVLLHTLRTQLDIFQKMIPELSKSFTVYAVDFPGHGWSDIPKKDYTLDFFVDSVERFLVKLDLHDVIFTGVSIGGSISLVIAGKNNKRIKGVISLNPYDYDGFQLFAGEKIPVPLVVRRAASEGIENDDVEALQSVLEASECFRFPYWMGELLEEAVASRSRRCFLWLLEQPELYFGGGELSLALAAASAAYAGATYYVRAIVEAGADVALPDRLDCRMKDSPLLLVDGAMASMKPEIVELARDSGAFARSRPSCLADAVAASIDGRHKHLIPCLIIFGQALLERFRMEGEVFVPLGDLIQMIRKLQEDKKATEESIALGNQLEAMLDPEEAIRSELMVYVESRRPRKMWKLLRQLPKEKFLPMATEILPSVGLYASNHYHPHVDKDPHRGWRDVEKLLDLGAGVDGTDFSGRTILMNVLWQTKHREDLILRLVDLGADVNAIAKESSWVSSEDRSKRYPALAVLDYCPDSEEARRFYAPLLRSLGARSIEELLEEREEGL